MAGGGGWSASRYFCTASRGLEPLLREEVLLKLSATQVEQLLGKVFFTADADLKKLRSLKCAERLFLLVKKLPPIQITRHKGKGIHILQKYVIGESSDWLNIVAKWKSLQDLNKEEECTSDITGTGLKRPAQQESGETRKRSKLELGEPPMTDFYESPTGQHDAHSVIQGGQQSTSPIQTPSSDELLNSEGQGAASSMNFRVSCRCSGKVAKMFTSQELGRVIGVALSRQLGWKAELRNPVLEVYVHLSDIHCVVGIPIVRLPLASRDYIKSAGLRSTVAWAMAYLADIKAGSLVLDPMCGLGTILLEAAKEWPNAYYHGVDNTASQLQMASANVCFAKLTSNIDLMRASVTESMNVVICDIPFGKKFKIAQDMKTIMPYILKEMVRVLSIGGTLVLLLSQELSLQMQQWQKLQSPPNNKGNLTAQQNTDTSPKEPGTDPEETIGVQHVSVEKEQSDLETRIFASLVPKGIFQVSLGVTEASIHKYKKIQIS
ncbi:THUMP domain-containing protein 2 isoform X2 [Hemiscyllium ocellatum]|uniref:THUMP domain-containing protein 2 isoform X2 n=1 Tax=Hemiscyllium ocellatum TaxID=170820 RepID=UPI00296607D1|nr:THUMP domain-containing protein 2 isoform X2 [Hemiscyllium ocellatum]